METIPLALMIDLSSYEILGEFVPYPINLLFG